MRALGLIADNERADAATFIYLDLILSQPYAVSCDSPFVQKSKIIQIFDRCLAVLSEDVVASFVPGDVNDDRRVQPVGLLFYRFQMIGR